MVYLCTVCAVIVITWLVNYHYNDRLMKMIAVMRNDIVVVIIGYKI